MTTVWNQMRKARVQVAIESVLLEVFNKPSQTLERRVIQSAEFQTRVLPSWADHSLKTSRIFTESNITNLTKVKVGAQISEDTKWFLTKLANVQTIVSESRASFPEELSLSGPKYPFQPRDLVQLQRKTDTLTGRELTRKIPVISNENSHPINAARVMRRREKEQRGEYRWRIEDDDDNLKDDLLAPKYSSF